MIVYLLAVLLILICFHVSTRYNKSGRSINKIPGLQPLPLAGNLPNFTGSPDVLWNTLRYLANEFYPIFKVWFVKSVVVFIRHPDDMKAILTCKHNINKSNVCYDEIRSVGNDGLVISNGPLWRHRRKILNQAFTPHLSEFYSTTIHQRANKYMKDLRAEGDVIVKNITEEFLKFALTAVCESTMGFDLDKDFEMGASYRKGFTEFSRIISWRIFHPYIPKCLLNFLPIGRQQSALMKLNNDFISKIINERRNYHASLQKNAITDFVNDLNAGLTEDQVKGEKRNLAVLDVLLLAEKKGLIDNDGIVSEVATIALAGYETTGTSIAFLLMQLAENTEAQDLARAELLEIVGDAETITSEHIKQLDYLERCMKESIRLSPPAPHIGRTISKEIVLSNYKVPVGTELFMNIYDLHRDPNFWPEPEKFDPDRFLPENIADRHPFAYVPFSAGLRNCIGRKFATNEMKIIVANIIREFYLEPVDLLADLKFELKVTLLVENVRLKFVKIKDDSKFTRNPCKKSM